MSNDEYVACVSELERSSPMYEVNVSCKTVRSTIIHWT